MIEFIGTTTEARLNRVDAKTRERILKNELVRCKDCRFNNTHCKHVNWWNGPDDFCSCGRRKADG